MKKLNKLTLGVLSVVAIAAPIATVVSCGEQQSPAAPKENNKEITKEVKIKTEKIKTSIDEKIYVVKEEKAIDYEAIIHTKWVIKLKELEKIVTYKTKAIQDAIKNISQMAKAVEEYDVAMKDLNAWYWNGKEYLMELMLIEETKQKKEGE